MQMAVEELAWRMEKARLIGGGWLVRHVPQPGALSHLFFFLIWEGSATKIDYRKKWVP